MAAPYLEISHLSKVFSSFRAVNDFSLNVNKGELVSLLGPSGCGKTTLLRAIAGLDRQTSGEIRIAGRDVSNTPASKRNFGILFQSYALFPNLSAADNIAYGLVARRTPRAAIEKRVSELLDLVDLQSQRNKYPAQLSGGQQQRVALARALATSPELLLLDEPLSALDAQVRVYLRDEIRSLQRRLDITTVLVTHDQEEALAISDTVVLMNKGAIEQIGAPDALYAQPASRFAATFIGTSSALPATALGSGTVRLGEHVLKTRPYDAPSASSVTICFRPEDVRLVDTADIGNTIPTCVARLSFHGASWRCGLALTGVPDAVVHADFAAATVRDTALAEGAAVRIAVDPDRISVFADS